MAALGRICQSSTAIEYLKTHGLLVEWRDRAVLICNESKPSPAMVTELSCLVSIFESLAVIDSVVLFLDSKTGGEFLKKAMQFVVTHSTVKHVTPTDHTQSSLSISQELVKLRNSLINLLKKCVCQAGSATKHRSRIASYLCELLRSPEGIVVHKTNKLGSGAFKQCMTSKQLNPTLLKMIHLLVLEDEKITVRFTDVHSENSEQDGPEAMENVEERMLHPMFGCNHNDRIVELPITAKKVRPHPSELQHQHGSFGGIGYSDLDEDFENFGLLNDWVYGMPGSSAYSLHPISKFSHISRKDRSPLLSDPYISAKSQLYCDAYSQHHPLHIHWSIASLVEGLNSVNRLSHTKRNSLLQKCLDEDEAELCELAAKPTSSTVPSEPVDSTDGYFTLTLRMRAHKAREGPEIDKQEQDPILAEFIENAPPVMSTLQHFAREGGLLELAKHLHLYHTFKQMLLRLTSNLASQTNAHAQNASTSGFSTPSFGKQAHPTSVVPTASDNQVGQLTDSLMAAVSSVFEVMSKQGLETGESAKPGDEKIVEEGGAGFSEEKSEDTQEVYDIMKMLEADQLSSSNAPTNSVLPSYLSTPAGPSSSVLSTMISS
uniref:Uncharacterized protein n=1 Tax=Ditylenchus dipsaci TaxID=166011 RepID=A0A915EBF1_9BILA